MMNIISSRLNFRCIQNIAALGLVLMLGLIAAGCQNQEPASPVITESSLVDTADPAESDQQAAPETASPEVVEEVDHCLDCHADQERLEAVANPVEVIESESSGEG